MLRCVATFFWGTYPGTVRLESGGQRHLAGWASCCGGVSLLGHSALCGRFRVWGWTPLQLGRGGSRGRGRLKRLAGAAADDQTHANWHLLNPVRLRMPFKGAATFRPRPRSVVAIKKNLLTEYETRGPRHLLHDRDLHSV